LLIYYFQRRSKLKADPSIKNLIKLKVGEAPPAETLKQDLGAEVSFSPAGDDKNAQQANLIRARNCNAYTELKDMIVETQFKRAEQVLMDFTRDSVNSRLLADGVWHALEPMDRETGDSILEALKNLGGLNPQDRRSKQSGSFGFKTELGKSEIKITTQGVPTGERAHLAYKGASKKVMNFSELGMFPKMVEQIKTSLNGIGLTIISAPPGGGLSTSWQGALATTDRLTRDCLALIKEDETDTHVENIVIKYAEPDKKIVETLRAHLLTQPDMVVMPTVDDAETMDMLTLHGTKHERAILTRIPAKSAAEALLRVYAKAGDRAQFLEAIKNVTCQRLVRRLCTSCRVEVRVQPNIIQKLGGNPKKQGTIFNQWQLPPPEQRVDERGREIEFPPCQTCGGIGYIGRIAVFEMITVSDQLKSVIKSKPKPDAIEAAAVKLGKSTIASETYKLVLLGVTSLAEAQRVLKQK